MRILFPAIDKKKTGIYLRRVMDKPHGCNAGNLILYKSCGVCRGFFSTWENRNEMKDVHPLYFLLI